MMFPRICGFSAGDAGLGRLGRLSRLASSQIRPKLPIGVRIMSSSAIRLNVGNNGDRNKASVPANQEKAGIWTLPNILTMSRIATAPLIGHYILTQNLTPAMCLFVYSCVTDFLDGYLARTYKMRSVAGTVLDPLADKVLMMTTTAALCLPSGPQLIPLPIAGLIFGRDLLLGLSAIYFRYTSMKHRYGKITWNTYWDIFHYPSAEVKPTQISKWNTFIQMIYVGTGVVLMIVNGSDSETDEDGEKSSRKENFQYMFTLLGYLVSATTVLSGASYVFSKDAVRYLSKPK